MLQWSFFLLPDSVQARIFTTPFVVEHVKAETARIRAEMERGHRGTVDETLAALDEANFNTSCVSSCCVALDLGR